MITAQPYRARPGKRMLTAKASGSVCVDGEWIDIKAGLDRVEAGHPIIQAAPHLFGSATVAAPRVSSPGGVKRVQSWHLRTNADSEADVICLDSRTPRFEVSLGLDLIGKIEREIHDALGFGVVETGGYLLGHAWDYIVMRTGPGPRSQHSADRFTLDDSHVRGWLNENPIFGSSVTGTPHGEPRRRPFRYRPPRMGRALRRFAERLPRDHRHAG